MRKFFFIALAAVLFLSSCEKKERANEGDLDIVFTTDIHGLVLPYNFLADTEASASLAQVAAFVEQLKGQGKECILLDAGDLGEGQPSTYYYNYVAENEQHVLGRTINFLGYDALGIGENEIQFGEAIYKRRMPSWFEAPIVCGNAYDMATAKTIFNPYTIVEKGGFRVAVLGLTSPDMSNWLSPVTIGNLVFDDLVRAAKNWVRTIKSEEDVDMIIGMFHINAEESKKIIQEVEGLDLVLCGQDHVGKIETERDPSFAEVSILQPLPRCQELGHAKVHLKRNPDGTMDKKIEVERVDLSTIQPSQNYIQKFADEVKLLNNYLDEPLGSISEDLNPIDALVGPSLTMNIIHDMQRWITGTKISITNFVSTYNMIYAGQLSTRDLFNLYRFENRLWTLKMTGKEIRDLLDYSYSYQYNTVNDSTTTMIAYELDSVGNVKMDDFGPMLKTAQYNYLSAAGIEYIVDLSKPAGERVQITALSDSEEAFNLDETYQVVVPDHLAVGTLTKNALGWDNNSVGTHIVSFSNNDIRNNFTQYLLTNSSLTLNHKYNWRVVPEDFYRDQSTKEKEFLSTYLK